ncbi:Fur family transcriptional regulator [Desulfoscipio gibsoniae]|uniref:Fe2+/Zn2+ uptake regulation protein n=1 Tax=Desulfoscipio gibsoniae DSM 7213 TaxID=767817 RepID=R4KSQ4_9FIRM|nr:Fur family transcriptional regulator [Desulfoscipio gibsoniae]AGL02626.1 Fe2+/Zn2+ uptake regulation protein [Desulfoscipio gibsoniae DSM 7213]
MRTQDIFDKLKEHGYKITPQRQEIINLMARENRHMTVEDIHGQISTRFPNLSVDTVYRNVGVLERLNMLDKTDFGDGKGRYKLVKKSGHRHHLICLKCGCSEEVDFCPLDYLDKQKIKDKKFAIQKHNFEIFGYCAQCLEKEDE